ncbi:MAG: carboxylesterase family protein [Nevskia sp.]|nr:carboxylesterase family protein [Nevskia sp.]
MTALKYRRPAVAAWAMLCASSFVTLAGASPGAPVIAAPAGMIAGIQANQTNQYLGIPYAAPPVGALRWKAPAPASAWSGVLQAVASGADCPQAGSGGLPAGSEDCLYLNVYVPQGGKPSKPVMAWIHGGAFVEGTGARYDGSALAVTGDVIVVTINYRLGWLGFLSHPALAAEDSKHSTGDYGLMDQQAALAWVRKNIAAFGGDAANVTIFGESAGGQSVVDQLASPGAKGLFHQAIVQSGTFDVRLPTMQSAEKAGETFATAQGCTSTSDASCLRGLSMAAIVASQSSSNAQKALTAFNPVTGGTTLPMQPMTAFLLGTFNRVPVLNGHTHDEARLFTANSFDLQSGPLQAADYPAAVKALLGPLTAPFALAFYPLSDYDSPDLAYASLYTDGGFACSARVTEELLARYVPVFAYEFSDENAYRFSPPKVTTLDMGAFHSSELPYLFPALVADSPYGATFSSAEQSLSNAMMSAWTEFARTGRPAASAGSAWRRYDPATDEVTALVPPAPQALPTHTREHKCNFWAPFIVIEAALPGSITGVNP